MIQVLARIRFWGFDSGSVKAVDGFGFSQTWSKLVDPVQHHVFQFRFVLTRFSLVPCRVSVSSRVLVLVPSTG
ncbi:hypothetical protein Hdeb2414_s0012g00389481 [Helianthus debilis subsp. tardiflorus]